MIDISIIKDKIINFLKERGPSLPVHIAKSAEISPVIASAILSELLNEQRVKMSCLKIGSSPLYLLQGQEEQLEKFIDNIKGFEKQALIKLKEKKILEDEKQEPAIRVALKSIKDFAIPFKLNEKMFWRYFSVKNEEIRTLLTNTQEEKQTQEEKPVEKEITPKQEETNPEPKLEERILKEKAITPIELEEKTQHTRQEEKPLQKLKPKKPKTSPAKFLGEIKEFLIKRDIELLQEIKTDKKEIIAVTRINSDLGKIKFLMIAKDKKRLAEADIIVAYQQAINQKMPCLLLCKGEPSKNTQKIAKEYQNLLKVEKIC